MERIRNIVVPQQYNPLQPTPPIGLGVQVQTDQFEEGIVVDVIVNNSHSEYASDGYNVGMVKFRRLVSNAYRAEDQLNWAYPLFANYTRYPLIGEVVYIFSSLNRWYYLSEINVSNRVTAQDLPELVTETDASQENSSQKIEDYRESSISPKKVGDKKVDIGEYFQDLPNVYRLKYFEGDIIHEGRSGQSIRFGTSWLSGEVTANARTKKIPWKSNNKDQSPHILIRVGPSPEQEKTVDGMFGQVLEDINEDKTSIWMVTDQIVPIKLATEGSGIHRISVSDFPSKFNENQLILNSDRIILNAKKKKIIINSHNGIHMSTLKDVTLDADRDHVTWTNRDRNDRVVGKYTSTTGNEINFSSGKDIIKIAGNNQRLFAKDKISLVSRTVHIGSQSSTSEPLVLGETLRKALEQLIQILITEPLIATTGVPGGPSPRNPAMLAQLIQWRLQYLTPGTKAPILSLSNFTIRNNETPLNSRKINSYQEG